MLVAWFKEHGIPKPELEYRFSPIRRWRFDFAWVQWKVALEIEGGIWTGGRHVRGKGFLNDLEKYSTAAVLGWQVLRKSTEQIYDDETIEIVKKGILSSGFWKNVRIMKYGCWNWIGGRGTQLGYGIMRRPDGTNEYAHRISLYLHGIELEKELTVDHLCSNKICVNPEHLEQVSRGENVRRALLKKLCTKGHEKRRDKRGRGYCVVCQRERRKNKNSELTWHAN